MREGSEEPSYACRATTPERHRGKYNYFLPVRPTAMQVQRAMHRVASSRPALKSSVSHSVRSFSTPPTPPSAPPRKPVLKWGDVLIREF